MFYKKKEKWTTLTVTRTGSQQNKFVLYNEKGVSPCFASWWLQEASLIIPSGSLLIYISWFPLVGKDPYHIMASASVHN